MELKDGTSVYSHEGKEVGRLQRVVLDPENHEVTHIVIEKGFLFTDDKVVPIAYVVSATDDRIDLECSAQDVEEMSPLDIEREYPGMTDIGPGVAYAEPAVPYVPAVGGVYPNPAVLPDMTTEVRRTISTDLVALDKGANVISSDDEHLGDVERYFTEPGEDLVSHIIVSSGLLTKTRKTVPVQWVQSINDEEIHLGITAAQYHGLPELKE